MRTELVLACSRVVRPPVLEDKQRKRRLVGPEGTVGGTRTHRDADGWTYQVSHATLPKKYDQECEVMVAVTDELGRQAIWYGSAHGSYLLPRGKTWSETRHFVPHVFRACIESAFDNDAMPWEWRESLEPLAGKDPRSFKKAIRGLIDERAIVPLRMQHLRVYPSMPTMGSERWLDLEAFFEGGVGKIINLGRNVPVAQLPKTARELFDNLIPLGLEAAPARARELAAIYAFKIFGADGGEWTVDCTLEKPTCVHGVSDKANVTIELASEDFQTMLTDPSAGMQLYFQGKLRVHGDPMVAMKLQHLFEIARPK